MSLGRRTQVTLKCYEPCETFQGNLRIATEANVLSVPASPVTTPLVNDFWRQVLRGAAHRLRGDIVLDAFLVGSEVIVWTLRANRLQLETLQSLTRGANRAEYSTGPKRKIGNKVGLPAPGPGPEGVTLLSRTKDLPRRTSGS